MPVYVVAQGRLENPEMLGEYVSKVMPTIRSGGGRILGFDESVEVVEGEIGNPRTVIIEFPTREAFRSWYDSADYQEIISLRTESAPGTLILVSGLPSA
jgi:uncharacterized protein (DUF1330 family)